MSNKKTERNLQLVIDYKTHKHISDIARTHNIHPSTVRECLIREMGEQEYINVKHKMIDETAERNRKIYLQNRKSIKR